MVNFDVEKDARYAYYLIKYGYIPTPPSTTTEDKKHIKEIVGYYDEDEASMYNGIYPFTNEKLKDYYKYRSLRGKDVLSVTASGDHILHAILAGATKIDAFDINPIAKYYAILKTAMIRTYDVDTFLRNYEFKSYRWNDEPPYLKSDIDIDEVKEFMDDYAIDFWKMVFNKNPKSLWGLFRFDGFGSYPNINNGCAYLDEDEYKHLQKKLSKSIITYNDLDITNPENYNRLNTYDTIFLSNINEYYEDNNTLNSCSNLLNSNGIIYSTNCWGRRASELLCGLKHVKAISPYISVYKKSR